MASMARDGDVRAQREYGAWLRRLAKSRRAYREAAENEEVETMAGFGYEVRVCVCAYVCGCCTKKIPLCLHSTRICACMWFTQRIRMRASLYCQHHPPHTHTHTHTHYHHQTRGNAHVHHHACRAMWPRVLTWALPLTQRITPITGTWITDVYTLLLLVVDT